MALFKKAKIEKKVQEEVIDTGLVPEELVNVKQRDVLNSFLSSVLEVGDESDYEYLCDISAKAFYKKNALFLESIIETSGDDVKVAFEYLNYFLQTFGLGSFQALIKEDDKEIIVYHYNSPFDEIYEKDYFLKEFYRLFFDVLLDTKTDVVERKEDDKKIFVINI
ncbi:MAG: hypothetical protein ABGX26_06610 [Nautiliaceae bacterium]|jgi:hypothetical protein